MRWSSLLLAGALAACLSAWAQAPDYANVGKTPTREQIKALDIAVGPEGKELPPGSGTAKEGAKIFEQKCVVCHGTTAEGIPQTGARLVGGEGSLKSARPVMTIGSYWPFATTLWDYINRAMPRNQGGTLSADEVYALTAFLLYKNGIIQENDVMDAKTLPKIQMPNRNGFVPARLADIADEHKRGCANGQCP